MKYNIPKYYRYVILFKEEMEDVEPIIKVPNLSELRSINKGICLMKNYSLYYQR